MQARSNPPLFRLFLALALAACGSETQPGDGGGGGGKTDDLGDGCTFDQPSPFGDTTEDLAKHAVGNLRVTAENVDGLTELEAAQLVAAVVHLGMAEPGIEPAAALALADGGEVDLVDIEMEGDDFMAADWVSFFAGDNETGVVFTDGTTSVIAEISDGDLMHCDPPPAELVCTFDQPSPLGDTTEDLAESSVGSFRVSAENVADLPALESAQLIAAVVHLGMAEEGIDATAALALADGGEIDLVDLEVEGDDFIAADWVSFFAGDNETGVVFADGTTQVIAEVSDGDIMHCE